MKKRVAGEAEDSFSRLDQIENRAVDLEGIKLKNEIEIDNLRAEVEDLEAAVKIAEEKARASLNEVRLIAREPFGTCLSKTMFDRLAASRNIVRQTSLKIILIFSKHIVE